MQIPNHKVIRALCLIGAVFGTLACALTTPPSPPATTDMPNTTTDAPVVALAAPLDGAAYEPDVPVNILARVSNAGDDIDRVEILVDGEIVSSVDAPNPAGAPVFSIAQNWIAAGNGPRTLGLTVFRADGAASETITRNIEVVGEAPAMVEVPADANPPTPTDNQVTGSGQVDAGSVLQGLFGNNDSATGSTAETETETETETTQPEPTTAPNTPDDSAEPAPQQAPPTDAPTPTNAPTATPDTSPRATTLAGVNVRRGPSTEYVTIGSFAPQTETGLLAVNSDSSWYKVEYYNGEGWIAANLLNVVNAQGLPIDDGPPLPTATPIPPTATPVPTAVASNSNITFADAPQGFTPYPPACGETMNITLRLTNTGTEALGTTSAAIIRDVHIASGNTTETIMPVPDIGPGETVEVTGGALTVNVYIDEQHRLEIELDANQEITESNEGDNVFSGGLEYTLARGNC